VARCLFACSRFHQLRHFCGASISIRLPEHTPSSTQDCNRWKTLLLDDYFVFLFPEHIFPKERKDLNWGNITYLQDSNVTINFYGRSLSGFGNPIALQFGNWAFQYPPIRNVWKDAIPPDTDVSPHAWFSKSHLDMGGRESEWLNRELWRKKPKLVVFGYIHAG